MQLNPISVVTFRNVAMMLVISLLFVLLLLLLLLLLLSLLPIRMVKCKMEPCSFSPYKIFACFRVSLLAARVGTVEDKVAA